jgi:hypothetical protein
MMPVQNRRARRPDHPRIHAFYTERGYGGGVRSSDTLLLAAEDAQLIGAVGPRPRGRRRRAARDAGASGPPASRNRKPAPGQGRRGGSGQRCYCIPYAHLVGFYSGIGFEVIAPSDAPDVLRERLESYRARADGREYLLMHRRPRDAARAPGHPARSYEIDFCSS